MIKDRLERHVKALCLKNLRDKRVKCCAKCPFQDDIEREFPETRFLFQEKQACLADARRRGEFLVAKKTRRPT